MAAHNFVNYAPAIAFLIVSINPEALAITNITPITIAITITKQKYDLAKFLLLMFEAPMA